MIDKKPSDIFHVITANGNQVQRLIVSKDLQIGTENNPAEIHLTGRMSQSVKTLSGPGGSQFSFPGNVAIVNVICTSQSGNMTITLPAGPRDGQTCYVKDASGTASKCNIIIKGTSSKVDGKDSYTINVAYGSVGFVWGSTGWLSLGGGSNSESTATYDGLVDPVSVALPADSDGVVTSYANAKTYVYGYKGSKELKSTTSTPGADQFSVTASGTSIFPGAQAQNTTENPAVFLPSGMNSASDTAKIEYTLTFEDGSTKKLIQNFTKSKNGTNGTNGTDGRDAYGSTLTPPSVVFAADAAGTVSSYSNGTATIRVFKGSTELNSVTAASTPGVDEFNVTAAGTNITPGSYSFTATAAAFSAVSNMTADTAYVTYTVTIGTSTGTTTQTLVQNFAKAKRGETGAAPNDVIVGGGDATRTNTLAYSLDSGVTWTGLGTTIFSTSCNAVIWTGRMWLATGAGTNTLAYSLNGSEWIGRGLGDLVDSRTSTPGNGTCALAYVPKEGAAQARTLFVGGNTATPSVVLIRSINSGQSWTDLSSTIPLGIDLVYSLVQAGEGSGFPNRIVLGGWDATAGRPGRSIAYSDNYGNTWTQVTCNLRYTYGMATNDSTIIAVGYDDYNSPSYVAVKSTNGGATWSPCATQPFGNGGAAYAIAWNGYYWVACGTEAIAIAPSVKISTNDGASWTSTTSTVFTNKARGLCWTGNRWIFVGGDDAPGEGSIRYTDTASAASGFTPATGDSAGILGDSAASAGLTVAARVLLPPNS